MVYFGWVGHCFGWVEVSGALYLGGWGIILNGWGCAGHIFLGVGVGGALFLVGGGEWYIILGGWG